VRQEERIIVVQATEVEAIEAEANYMWIQRNREAYPILGTLASLEQRLDPGMFHRCHRSWLVNLKQVKELVLDAPGGPVAVTRSGQRVPVSHRHRRRLEEALEG
jgi:DNA-binding LytR/AlgR family response regulator